VIILIRNKLEDIFYFCRDSIKFGYYSNKLTYNAILSNKKGSCYNKSLVFFNMCKENNIPVRFGAIKINKKIMKEIISPVSYLFWPKEFIHIFPEVKINSRWIPLDVTFDKTLFGYLSKTIKKDINFDFSYNGVLGIFKYYNYEYLGNFQNLEVLNNFFNNLSKIQKLFLPIGFFNSNLKLYFIRLFN